MREVHSRRCFLICRHFAIVRSIVIFVVLSSLNISYITKRKSIHTKHLPVFKSRTFLNISYKKKNHQNSPKNGTICGIGQHELRQTLIPYFGVVLFLKASSFSDAHIYPLELESVYLDIETRIFSERLVMTHGPKDTMLRR